VVSAVREGKFHIYAVSTVDEGIEVLTGVPAGARDGEGRYPQESLNGRVEKKLAQYADRLRQAAAQPKGLPRETGPE
jgi:predicted ATP-dependent protease